jgi:hypothetical protein
MREEKKPFNLAVDHLIPLSLLGPDHPGNWIALCRRCNRQKWQHFAQGFIKSYRRRTVVGNIGVRYEDDCLWPVIQRQATACDTA